MFFAGRITAMIAITLISVALACVWQQVWPAIAIFVALTILYFNVVSMVYMTNKNQLLIYELLIKVDQQTRF